MRVVSWNPLAPGVGVTRHTGHTASREFVFHRAVGQPMEQFTKQRPLTGSQKIAIVQGCGQRDRCGRANLVR